MVKIPNNYTEEQVLEIINRISNRLANRYKFGYHDTDDMRQQATLIALEGLESYDEGRPLENFLWVHVKNRLYNFKRNNFARPDKPCLKCPLNAYVNGKCTAFDNEIQCEIYEKWYNRNEIKKSLMSTREQIEVASDDEAESMDDKILARDAYRIIDKNMPASLREDWIRFANKLKLPKNKKVFIVEKIKEILEENGIVT